MYTLSSFARRLHHEGATRDVALEPGEVHWLPAQVHCGENIGSTDTHVLFVELKELLADALLASTLRIVDEVDDHHVAGWTDEPPRR
jgi:hypothetical protein